MVAIFPPTSMFTEPRYPTHSLLIQENSVPHQSAERKTLQEFQSQIVQRLTPSENQLNLTSEENDFADYRPIPPKRTFTAKARFKFTGRTKPLPYPSDSE